MRSFVRSYLSSRLTGLMVVISVLRGAALRLILYIEDAAATRNAEPVQKVAYSKAFRSVAPPAASASGNFSKLRRRAFWRNAASAASGWNKPWLRRLSRTREKVQQIAEQRAHKSADEECDLDRREVQPVQ